MTHQTDRLGFKLFGALLTVLGGWLVINHITDKTTDINLFAGVGLMLIGMLAIFPQPSKKLIVFVVTTAGPYLPKRRSTDQ